jgi:hypothetical protein
VSEAEKAPVLQENAGIEQNKEENQKKEEDIAIAEPPVVSALAETEVISTIVEPEVVSVNSVAEVVPIVQKPTAEEKVQPGSEKSEEIKQADLNVTPNLMDESIISVVESPPQISRPPKDSTFSPIVDTSINDSRPNIDDLNLTPSAPVKASIRTSAPLVQKRANTPMLAEKCGSEDIFEEPMKPNLPEKSILKSSRRGRSKSVSEKQSTEKQKAYEKKLLEQIEYVSTFLCLDEIIVPHLCVEKKTGNSSTRSIKP